jgi:hypothetical protein
MAFNFGQDTTLSVSTSGPKTQTGIVLEDLLGGATNGAGQQVCNALLQDRVGRETDCVEEILGFQKRVDVW